MASEKEQLLQVWETESATTRKAIAAIPEAKRDFRPHEKARSARELAWHLVEGEKFFVDMFLTRTFEVRKDSEAPATIREVLEAFDRQHRALAQKVRAADDKQFAGTIQIPVGPKKMGDVPMMGILWTGLVLHGVHHRGQLSTYLRIMGEKVPSIIGPSADEPWM